MNGIEKIERTVMKNKTVSATASTIGVGMISSISFSIIDSIFFLFIEEHLQDYWKKRELTENIIPIINGGLSSSISILIAMFIENYLERHFDMFKHPLIDATGMIIGTIIILLTYKLFIIDNKPIVHAFRKKSEYEKISVGDIQNVNANMNSHSNDNKKL
jgi:hypothetical protein